MASQDFGCQLQGYGLTTARIFYRRPDHLWLLQTYVWQQYDLWPEFPVLQKFLAFWRKNLEGPLHSVTVAHSRLIRPAEIRALDGVFRLH
jgi:uncharacterized protein Usg